ncbi:MAG: hemolysin family protein [Oscillospiraceae bacterium]|nr:hemolysin family protein [Oscillospiraceae bacterium]
MDGGSIAMVAAMVGLIILSGFFSATETAFSSLNRIRVKNLAASGHKRYALVLKLSEKYDTLLSAILIGNNIVNILCTSIATVFFTKYWGDFGVTLSTIVITVVVLLFGEVSPKTVAKEKAEAFAAFSAPVIQLLMWILIPINSFFIVWKKLLAKVFHLNGTAGFTEEELITIVEEVESDGVIDQHEGELIRSAIEFNDLDAADILTPRVDVIGVEISTSMEEILRLFREHEYTRMPVYREDMDHIVGILHEKDFNQNLMSGKDTIEDIIKPPVNVSEGIKISKLLRLLQYHKSHMAVVVDEFGGTAGIVTLEDILEELVGEIWDEHDEVTEDIKKNEDGSYTISCNAGLDKLREMFHIEKDYDCATVSGWVMEELGKVPEEGDTFTYDDLNVTVTKVDFRRAVEIHVVVAKKEGS